MKSEIKEVEELEDWQASPPFLQNVLPTSGRFKKSQKSIETAVAWEASHGALWQRLSWGVSSAPGVLWPVVLTTP